MMCVPPLATSPRFLAGVPNNHVTVVRVDGVRLMRGRRENRQLDLAMSSPRHGLLCRLGELSLVVFALGRVMDDTTTHTHFDAPSHFGVPQSHVGPLFEGWRPEVCKRIALVLQGGGALGAYQAGVYQALHEAGIEPDFVSGVSIGAINAAIIAGNSPDRRLSRLR